MRRPRVATVLTAQPWEAELVARARETGRVRIVGRGYRPEDIVGSDPDIAVVGFETAWLDDDVIGWWRLRGIDTVVVGAPHEHAEPTLDADHLLAEVCTRWLQDLAPQPDAITIVGPRGAGVTEVACAVATLRSPSTIIDRDPPAVAMRLPNRSEMDVLDRFPTDPTGCVVIDAGADTMRTIGRCILVVEGTPLGFVRGASLIEEWTAPVPDLVINKTHDRAAAVRRARHALGLEPAALIPYDISVASATAQSEPVTSAVLEPLRTVIREGGQSLR